jgi:hypothetical protein
VRYECNVAFCSLLLKLKQIHNLKNRVFPHIISDYKENPRPTFFVNSLENSTISICTLCEKLKKKMAFLKYVFYQFLCDHCSISHKNTCKISRNFKRYFFLNLAQYFRMDERTIVPILSKFRHFSMLCSSLSC